MLKGNAGDRRSSSTILRPSAPIARSIAASFGSPASFSLDDAARDVTRHEERERRAERRRDEHVERSGDEPEDRPRSEREDRSGDEGDDGCRVGRDEHERTGRPEPLHPRGEGGEM